MNFQSGRWYTLDHILLPDNPLETTFQIVAREGLKDFLRGLNGCIVAYGQTESGKTHSIFGTQPRYSGILTSFGNGDF